MSIFPPANSLELFTLANAVPAVALTDARARRRAALGIATLALAAATLHVMPGAMPVRDLARRSSELGIGPETLAVDGGFLVAAVGLLLLAAVGELRRAPPVTGRVAASLLAAGALMVTWSTIDFLRLAGPARSALAAIVLTAFAWGLAAGAHRSGASRLVRRALAWCIAPAADDVPAMGRQWVVVIVVGSMLAVVLPTLWTTIAAGIVVATAAALAAPRSSRPGALVVTTIGAFVLAASGRFIAVITGDIDPRLATLADAPFSTPAEYLLAPLLLAGLWCWLGIAPFSRLVRDVRAAPVALVIVVRIAIPAAGDGVDHWRPLIWTVVAAAVWIAAVTRRRDLVIVSAALLALTAAIPDPIAPLLLVVVGGAVALGGVEWLPARWVGAARVGWIAVAWGAAQVLEAAIAQQVVLTLLAFGAVLLAIVAPPAGPPRTQENG